MLAVAKRCRYKGEGGALVASTRARSKCKMVHLAVLFMRALELAEESVKLSPVVLSLGKLAVLARKDVLLASLVIC